MIFIVMHWVVMNKSTGETISSKTSSVLLIILYGGLRINWFEAKSKEEKVESKGSISVGRAVPLYL